MKQIVRCVIDRGGKVRLIDTPRPICGDKEILVANENSLISIAGLVTSTESRWQNIHYRRCETRIVGFDKF